MIYLAHRTFLDDDSGHGQTLCARHSTSLAHCSSSRPAVTAPWADFRKANGGDEPPCLCGNNHRKGGESRLCGRDVKITDGRLHPETAHRENFGDPVCNRGEGKPCTLPGIVTSFRRGSGWCRHIETPVGARCFLRFSTNVTPSTSRSRRSPRVSARWQQSRS